jgi:hypothetical protein
MVHCTNGLLLAIEMINASRLNVLILFKEAVSKVFPLYTIKEYGESR